MDTHMVGVAALFTLATMIGPTHAQDAREQTQPCPPDATHPEVSCSVERGGQNERPTECAAGAPDCLLLGGREPENTSEFSLVEYEDALSAKARKLFNRVVKRDGDS